MSLFIILNTLIEKLNVVVKLTYIIDFFSKSISSGGVVGEASRLMLPGHLHSRPIITFRETQYKMYLVVQVGVR
jgi:hypothetical protein